MRIRVVALLVLVIASSSPALPAVRRVGSEFQVNSYTTSYQLYASVATGPSGDFVVVWSSLGQDGSSYGTFGRRFTSLGAPIGGEFRVNTYTTSFQFHPVVAADGTGGFVVVWTSNDQDGSGFGIFSQRYDSTGDPMGSEFQVNTYTTSFQFRAAIAAGVSGEFVVVWSSFTQDGSNDGIFAQRFDSGGMSAGVEFQVNTYTTGLQRLPAVAMDDSGSFVVIWESHGQDGDIGGIFAQRYDSGGARVGAEFQVNSHTTGTQLYPGVAAHGDGDFMVVWQSPKPATFEIAGQRYDSSGQPLGGEFQVAASAPYDQFYAAVAAEGSGGFVVVWEESFADGSGVGIIGRRIDATGTPVGGDFQVNTYTTGLQRRSTIGMNATGHLVVAWESADQDGSDYGIFAQRFRGRAPGLTSHMTGDLLDCSNPATTRPTFTWDPDGYDRFRVYLASDSAFGKGTVVTSGDSLRPETSWEPSAKKWRKACMKAIAADPLSPEMFIRILGKDTDLGKNDPARLLFGETVTGDVQP